jgi:hypothetical protein
MTIATTYSVNAVNNSGKTGTFCVYQTDSTGVPNLMSLAWLTKNVSFNMQVQFSWTIDYSFVWGETGVLVPGVIFQASQNLGADLSSRNLITFTKSGGQYMFINQTAAPSAGSLFINEDATIPLNQDQAAVGIGMSGAGTFVTQAQPNWDLVFTPPPRNWITFGFYQRGQVLDTGAITDRAEISFPPNVFFLTATYGADRRWTVSQGSGVEVDGRRAG